MSNINGTSRIILVDSMQIGSVVGYPSNAIPDGYLECNGQAINRVAYAELFNKIGIYYGAGDGVSTFNLPDYRGRFLRHNDNGKGLDPSRVLGSVQADAMQGHIHSVLISQSPNPYNYGFSYGSTTNQLISNTGSPVSDGTNGTPRTGAETRPVNISIIWCMKVKNVGFDTSGLTLTPTTFASLGHTTHIGEASLLTQNGYKKFADGTIIQWGCSLSSNPSNVSFPIVFPNNCYSVIGNATNNGGSRTVNITASSPSLFTCLIFNAGNTIITGEYFFWYAIGR